MGVILSMVYPFQSFTLLILSTFISELRAPSKPTCTFCKHMTLWLLLEDSCLGLH